jgi:O-antigen ligase
MLTSLVLTAYVVALLALGLRRPFVWVLAYLYIDIVAPQKIAYVILPSLSISLVLFAAAFAGWLIFDNKQDSRFTLRQTMMLILLVWCGITTLAADFPIQAAEKWGWVWKAMVFAIFLPLTLRTRLRIEAAVLTMVLSLSALVVAGGIKTAGGGGGYGQLKMLIDDNTGLNEGSIISCIAIAAIPLVVWLFNHSTLYPKDWRSKLYTTALVFACLLIPVGTQARTGLLCIALLCVLFLRATKRRFLWLALMGMAGMAAVPFLPQSFTARMSTIENHKADQSASTRLAIWGWTLDYVADNPMGGGFDAYLGNKVKLETQKSESSGSTTAVETTVIEDKSRAYHSSYFEMLGEQGYPGFALWLLIHVSGLWQMERIRRRYKNRTSPDDHWQAPLATALQHAQLIYLLGAAFVGIAFQPFVLMLVGVQCGLWSYLKRIEQEQVMPRRAPLRTDPAGAVAAS